MTIDDHLALPGEFFLASRVGPMYVNVAEGPKYYESVSQKRGKFLSEVEIFVIMYS